MQKMTYRKLTFPFARMIRNVRFDIDVQCKKQKKLLTTVDNVGNIKNCVNTMEYNCVICVDIYQYEAQTDQKGFSCRIVSVFKATKE